MKKIVFYKLNGQVKSEEILTKENLEHIHGMMTKCTMVNGIEEVGFADPTGVYNEKIYDGRIHDYIYLWTWDSLNEETGDLIGDGDEKYNQTYKPVKIDDIEKVEAITYSNPRWGGKLTNKFEFYINDNNESELEIPKFLIKDKQEKNNDSDEEMYYYLTVKYEEHYSNKEYNYISEDTSVKVGDRVLVDMAGELVVAEVLETAYCDKFDAPFPVHKTKKIIKKVDKDFDIRDIEFYDEENDNLPDNVLYMNIDDTYFELGIFDYVRGENNDDNWANLIVKVKNRNFNYLRNAELMTSAEVERLLNGLQKLLNDELKEKEGIGFYEPDLEFDLYPKMNLWDTGNYAYIKKGHEIQDIYVEFTINLTDREGTYTGQKYVIILDREEIEKIVKYMKKIVE